MIDANERHLRAVVLRIGRRGAQIANPLPQVDAAYTRLGMNVTATTTIHSQAKLTLLTVFDHVEHPP